MARKKVVTETTFEQDIAKIEELVSQMRAQDLDATVDSYIEAMKLILKCKNLLEGYRLRVESITKDGAIEPAPLEENDD